MSLPFDYFDQLREENQANVERVENLDVVTFDDGSQLGFCHLVHLAPTSFFPGPQRVQFTPWPIAESIAAMFLAMRQLNTGDGSVVKEVEGLNERCNIRFTAEIFDTALSEVVGVTDVLKIVKRDPTQGGRLPCAFLGAIRSAVTMPTSIITGIKGYPQFSAGSTSPALHDKSQYKLFGRTIPADDGTAIPAILLLKNKFNIQHLAVVHTNDSYGSEYARALQQTAKELAPDMKVVPAEIPSIENSAREIEAAVSIIAATEYKYIYAIVFSGHYNDIMEEAYRQGVAGPGYTWIFADIVTPETITSQQFEPESPLAIASQGVSVMKAEGGIPGMPGYDRFMKAFLELQNEDDVAYIDSQIPSYEDDEFYEHQSIANFIHESVPPTPVTFLYDATIALGLAACNVSMEAEMTNNSGGKSARRDSFKALNGAAHFAATHSIPFEGASGQVILDPSTGGRDPNSAVFQLTNVIQNEELDPETGKATFRSIPSERFQNGEWQTVVPYVFSDGSTNPPLDLPPLSSDYLYIGTGLRTAGLLLSCIAMGMAIGFSTWTYLKRFGKVVKVSQPIFLYIICFGNFLMASAIIPLSMDDDILSTKGCTISCMATYWLFWLGFAIAFSALFSKTWRLNKLFYNQSNRRIAVSVKEVTKPMILMVTMNVITLSVWTIVSPLKWQRIGKQFDVFGRSVKSQGICENTYSLLFQTLMGLLNGTFLVFSLYQVYRARHITNEFGETLYITAAISGMLLVSSIGVPVMIIASDNSRAHFFVLCCIIFVICSLFLLFIFVPKIHFHIQIIQGKKSMRNIVQSFSRQSGNISRTSRNAVKAGGSCHSFNSQEDEKVEEDNNRNRMSTYRAGVELPEDSSNHEKSQEMTKNNLDTFSTEHGSSTNQSTIKTLKDSFESSSSRESEVSSKGSMPDNSNTYYTNGHVGEDKILLKNDAEEKKDKH